MVSAAPAAAGSRPGYEPALPLAAGWPRLRRWSSRCECTTSHTANADCQHTDPNHLGSVEQFRAGKLALDASRLPRLLALQAHRTAARDAFFTAASFCANADFCELPPPVPPFFARTFKKFSAPTLLTAHLSADRTWPVVRPDLLALPTMIWQGAAAAGRQTTLMARARTVAVCVPLPFVAKTVPLPCVCVSTAFRRQDTASALRSTSGHLKPGVRQRNEGRYLPLPFLDLLLPAFP